MAPQNTSFPFLANFRGCLSQVQQIKLVNKVDEAPKGVFIDTHTKLQQFWKKIP